MTKSEEIVRDLFIIACMTALRFSDFSRLKEENFIDNQIQIKTQKTGTLVIIPQSKYVRALLRKYNYQLPKCPCIQHFNKVIKNVCKKAGIIAKVPYERTVGLDRISEMVEKWKRIGSHSGRRSAATNMFLAGIPALRIMKITGHKTEEAFMRYIGLSKEENAAVLAGNMFFH
ncbi:site-specific integrase [Parabacteroides goldsteinii]